MKKIEPQSSPVAATTIFIFDTFVESDAITLTIYFQLLPYFPATNQCQHANRKRVHDNAKTCIQDMHGYITAACNLHAKQCCICHVSPNTTIRITLLSS